MPVALPPSGWYLAHIDDLDEGTAHPADHVRVEAPAAVRLQGIWIGGPRWRVMFSSPGA
jgi:hypothetical protein